MITEEQLTKILKQITLGAWRAGTNTTLNDTIEYIIREALVNCVMPELETLHEKLTIQDDILNDIQVQLNLLLESIKDEEDASETRGIQKPRRNAKAA